MADDLYRLERKHQLALHKRLVLKASQLLSETVAIRNFYPALARNIEEYAKLIARPIDKLNIVDLWSVGIGLSMQARPLESQSDSVLREYLESSREAPLLELLSLHGAFILGFPEARELSAASESFQLASNKLSIIEEFHAALSESLSSSSEIIGPNALSVIKSSAEHRRDLSSEQEKMIRPSNIWHLPIPMSARAIAVDFAERIPATTTRLVQASSLMFVVLAFDTFFPKAAGYLFLKISASLLLLTSILKLV